ncbi:SIMPL domain-containing protein [Paracoccus cavernae]|uniref:SIMPL domain-containing protein n=1 Tax=Paracoccus cavernae TaxID=1571207 RepID=A0ABT8D9X2_9RHOB|nr:SIMPL domain-containing protein [Paracoccus cavernae]
MKPEMIAPAHPSARSLQAIGAKQARLGTGAPSRRIHAGIAAKVAAGITALALGAAALPALAQTPPVPADAPQPPHQMGHDKKAHPAMARLTVTAEGESAAQPDLATISLGVSVQAETAAAAMAENATRQQTVIDKLKAEGIEARDIQTSGLSLSPVQNYSQDGKPPVITGYMAQNMVTLRVRDLARLGPVLDMLVEAGANEINGINFTREDTTEAEDAARTNAVAAAHHKAEVMAEAAGMKLGRLIALSDGAVSNGPRPMMMATANDAKGRATPIEAGELSISASVSATYALIAADGAAE